MVRTSHTSVAILISALASLGGCGGKDTTSSDAGSTAGSDGSSLDSATGQADGSAATDASAGSDAAEVAEDGSTTTTDAGGPVAPPSCDGLPATCGPTGDADCCETIHLTGGAFRLGQDEGEPDYFEPTFRRERSVAASVSPFCLDRFEVTVGRFRRYVAAGAPLPAIGAGKHVHLNGGAGLMGEEGYNETGVMPGDLELDLTCLDHADATWTDTPGANENKPVTCMTWWHAYGFCVWDGGFLPTEAEWEYAASGGEERYYPWSSPPNQNVIDAARSCSQDCDTPIDVGTLPMGNARWGHADMAGNVYEWLLDRHSILFTEPCNDCLQTPVGTDRAMRGGAYHENDGNARSAARLNVAVRAHSPKLGIRCARPPR